MGILDRGFDFRAEVDLEVLHRTSKFLKGQTFGLRLSACALDEAVVASFPSNLGMVAVVEAGGEDWSRLRAILSGSDRVAVAEVTSRESCRAAAEAGFEALIVAGNEAGGRVAEESSFILLQAALGINNAPPVWVRGGIGLRSASACVAAGAAGVVLDGAVLLAKESPLQASLRRRIERWDGSETILVGREVGDLLRIQAEPGSPALARLKQAATEGRLAWESALRREVGWSEGQVRPVGQDAALAGGLARTHVTVGGIVQAVERAIDLGLRDARSARPLDEDSPLARSHRTRYPIVQGPMTRVSDLAAFAEAVAEGGALPFLALALMRGPEIGRLLTETAARLNGSAWGVGILGFVPPDLRLEQIEEVRRARPSFALIAGGRPDQAQELEREGIATYLHAPSPGLLRQYWNDGARRFVLEGRECGGHVGPRSSLLLWEQAVEVVHEMLEKGGTPDEVHLLFAGGIHDARSASAVAALSGPLARRGVRVGVLIGTAYLFTAEAVATGAIVAKFQDEAVRCTETVLLETGPGHEVRVSPTPYVEAFELERKRLLAAGRSNEELRTALEGMNAGRLRIAAKGIERNNGAGSPLVGVAAESQTTRGLYMLGQAATLRQGVSTIAALHQDISAGGMGRIDRLADALAASEPLASSKAEPCDIAIVGMSAIVPGAGDVRTFWENTLHGIDAITEVPADRWDWRLYYDADPKAPDKITSKWGGFVPEIAFDPLRYGMPPTSLPSIEPLHLLTLEAVRAAIDDAGYRDRPFPREKTAVVLGAGGGAAQLAMGYAFRSYLPMLDTLAPGAGREALEQCEGVLPEWTEDSFPGILLNVAAGRVANRFDLGGANYTVDAACGSSLAAASVAVRELESGAADVVILGGADTVQNPFTYLAFSKTHAFSPRGRCRPFDASADGIVISEAVAVVVLKRLADAERDGDRIYSVIKGLGASSDGRAKGLTAPRPEGQIRALRRAYAKAGIDPATVGYVEAHGTGTAAGDLAEVNALNDVFIESGAPEGRCALGSVKSLIGHTKCAAGLVGLINASLALHHRVLPPTIGVVNPSAQASRPQSPFHISTKTRPWIHTDEERPRRAGVSAFGFGGTNFHAVLEAYEGAPAAASAPLRDWPAELFVWRAADRTLLLADLERLSLALEQGAKPALRDLAHTLLNSLGATGLSLAIVASTLDEVRAKVDQARATIAQGVAEFHDPRGIAFAEAASDSLNRVAFLFPGQGAQRVDMLGELAVLFPEVRSGFESFDNVLREQGKPLVSPVVFPPPAFQAEERDRQKKALAETEVAQPALGGASLGLLWLLESLHVAPDMVAGHSYGELVALHAAGVYSLEALVRLSEARGRFIKAAAGDQPGMMAALAASPDQVETLLQGLEGVSAVNWNGPRQTVVSGRSDAVAAALGRARQSGLRGQELAVSCAFHSPIVAGACRPLAELANSLAPQSPQCPVFSNVTGTRHTDDPTAIAAQVGAHVASPVRFASMIEAMHDAGARVFIEVGPGATLTSLVGSILGGRSHLAVACDPSGRPGVPGLLHALARLFVAGLPLHLEPLTAGRTATILDRVTFVPGSNPAAIKASTWLVNGSRARPANGPEPKRLGPGPALPLPEPGLNPVHATPSSNGNGNGPLPSPSKNGKKAPEIVMPPPVRSNPPVADQGRERVLEAFQKTMQMFLEVQRETMLGFLGTPSGGTPSQAAIRPSHENLASPAPNGQSAPQPPAVPSEAVQPASAKVSTEVRPEPVVPTPVPVESPETSIDVAARLLSIVQDRTGYPAEMLRLDLDLEADLGIDSIKRVEILGTLREVLPGSGLGSNTDLMDQLSRARTLGAIVEKVERGLKSSQPTLVPAPASAHTPAQSATNGHANALSQRSAKNGSLVRRLTLKAVAAPLSRTSGGDLGLAASGLLLVTDDGRGVSHALAGELRSKGHPVVVVGHSSAGSNESDSDVQSVDLTSPAAVDALLARLRNQGPLAGIIHALPLQHGRSAGLDSQLWSARMGPESRGLFLLARAGADDLTRAAEQGGACLIACTAMGGSFASAGAASDDFFPGQGAVAGIVKTLAREWCRAIRVRVVDFDPREEATTVAANLIHEIEARDRRTEVGYLDRSRVALRVVESPLSVAGRSEWQPALGEPILVTGGARGITAVLTTEMAKCWKPTFLMVGTTPLPREDESRLTVGVTNPATLKSLLHQRLTEEEQGAGLVELERAYQTLRRQREIRSNLERLRTFGSQVDYAQVDVRDLEALRTVLARWQARFGPVRGLIHGAGVIHDKLLRDKTLESYDRVLGTKLDGALNLASLLDPDSLRFAAFFSSVAGRFGNRGQVDYAAANETLNKLALWLDRRWAGRVVSVNWGPWSGVGMVSDLESHLQGQGLGMISPDQDAHRLTDELRLGRKGEVEVVIAGEIGSLLDPDEKPSRAGRELERINEDFVMS
ncbi:polyketide synthase family protein [Singulisphaera acidiphila DSM 18658]|uniref:Polyketide synthase family protein n=2 Tax=Singulisphaera acidiphila TaxID=466153 RepID=L0DLZ0_SINAD|nr:polyketide synthase family protein [Singulisphaera acidiphila DSM 18658]